MNVRRTALTLCLFAIATVLQASDLSTLKRSCAGRVAERGIDSAGTSVVTYSSPGSTDVYIYFNDAGAYQDPSDAKAGAQIRKACEAAMARRAKKTDAPQFEAEPASAAPPTTAPAVVYSPPDSDVGSVLVAVLVFVVAFSIYFMPAATASHRGCKAAGGIFVVNLFLGWTFVGWVVALAWAVSGETEPKPSPTAPAR